MAPPAPHPDPLTLAIKNTRLHLKALLYHDACHCSLHYLRSDVKRNLDDAYADNLVGLLEEVVAETSPSTVGNIAVLQAITERYRQIKGAHFQKQPMRASEALRTAYFIETVVRKMITVSTSFFTKEEVQLAHDIHCNMAKKRVYVISPPDLSNFYSKGSTKRVSSAIELKIDEPHAAPTVVAHAFMRDGVSQEEIDRTFKEISFYKRFQDNPSIVQLLSSCTYISTHKRHEDAPQRLSMIFKKYTANLRDALFSETKKIVFTPPQIFTIVRDLIHSLYSLHEKRVIHGDIKLENTLYSIDERGNAKAVLSDLGFAFTLGHDKRSFIYDAGYYGSIDPTPPEVLGECYFDGDYFKTDIWALGILFTEFLNGEAPSWTTSIRKFYDRTSELEFAIGFNKALLENEEKEEKEEEEEITPQKREEANQLIKSLEDELEEVEKKELAKIQEKIFTEIETCIESALKKYTETTETRALFRGERLISLVCKMVRFYPESRITMREAKTEIDAIMLLPAGPDEQPTA